MAFCFRVFHTVLSTAEVCQISDVHQLNLCLNEKRIWSWVELVSVCERGG